MKLKLATKLYLTVGIACLTLITLGTISFSQMKAITRQTNELIKEEVKQIILCNNAKTELGKAVQAYKNYLIRKDDNYVTEFREHAKKIETAINEYLSLKPDSEELKLGQNAKTAFDNYAKCIDDLVSARAKSDDIAMVDKSIKGVDKPLAKALAEMEELSSKSFESRKALFEKETTSKLVILMACALLTALLVAAQGVIVARNLTRRLTWFSDVISRVADKDLTARIKITVEDELGIMGKNFNSMMEEIEALITSIQGVVVNVAEKSRNLHGSASLMEKNAEEVSAQSQSVATASEEMAATSADIANNCGSAAQGAKHASDTAHSGAEVVQNTIGGMHRISEQVRVTATTIEALGTRSDQIGEIVGTIEDIADQTNLLALNAAIEAARAGEQGRGFAVVADEVRALAERTTKATKEIGNMIKSIQSETKGAVTSMEHALGEVVKGSEDAERSGTALQEILNQIEQVNMQVSQIATAAEEQNATTGEITNYIQSVTSVMHGAAEMAKTSTGAADELAALADSLKAEMQRFKTDGSQLFILDLAKDDHRTFVDNIEAVLKGTRKQEGAKVSTSHTCRFGKWYDSDGTALCGHLSSFKAISTPHDRIHSVARQVVDAVNAGNTQQAEQLFPQMKELSREIVSLLGDIKKECDQNKQQSKAA